MMSLPSSNENPIPGAAPRHRKPEADIYTVLLVVSLLAIILGIVFLYLETADYGDQKTQGGPMAYLESPAVIAPFEGSQASSRRLKRFDPCRLLC